MQRVGDHWISLNRVIPFEKSGGFPFYSINHTPLTPISFLSLPTLTFPGFFVHFELARGLVKSSSSTPCWKCTDAFIDVVLHVFLLQYCAWKAAKFLERWALFLNSIEKDFWNRLNLYSLFGMTRDSGRKKQDRRRSSIKLPKGAYTLDKRLVPRVKEVNTGSE